MASRKLVRADGVRRSSQTEILAIYAFSLIV
jgi:hypothetical protein